MSVSKNLVSYLCSSYKDIFDKNEIENIISIDGGVDGDVTTSFGVHLKLSKIRIIGKKGQDREEEFQYERTLYPGINTLISDNLKGKSSIFKCIKFALTGKNSLKKDVSKWIDYIYLEFKIGDDKYTSYIDNSGGAIKAGLYREFVDGVMLENIDEANKVFSVSNKELLEGHLENFFYKQLGISSLKWTQKDSRKDVHALHEAGTSWITFYKTIYLESKDSHSLMYGSQGDLLIQKLLGLGLTTAMNRLKIKKDMIQFESTRSLPDVSGEDQTDKKVRLKCLNEKLKLEKENVERIYSNSYKNNLDYMIGEKSTLISVVQELENEKISNIKNNSKNHKILYKLETESKSLQDEKIKLEEIIYRIEKKHLKINEHIEIGSFFSNLDIKSCPSCNKILSDISLNVSEDKSCQLCHHDMKDSDRQEDVSRMKNKLNSLSNEREKVEVQVSVIKSSIESLTTKLFEFKKHNTLIDVSINDEKIVNAISKVECLEGEIESGRENLSKYEGQIRASEDVIAVIKYKISKVEEIDTEVASGNVRNGSVQSEIALLGDAISYLEKVRSEKNNSVIDKLKGFILEVLHSLGLNSFAQIHIDSRLRISYEQGGERLVFSEITEGEQLRVKIALYLALVKLNSEYGVGNHPRILIIDSPGKEEADNRYFEGFIETLNVIEERFSNKIQIFIGSADRRLVDIVPSKKQDVISQGEAVF